MSIANSSILKERTRRFGTILLNATTFLVFLFLDLLDAILCLLFKLLDDYFEGKASPCYCESKEEGCGDGGRELCSETLYSRENVFREMGLFGFARKWEFKKKIDIGFGGRRSPVNRWSDCGCESCLSWMNNNNKLHFVVRELPQVNGEDSRAEAAENVIFLHGFLSSSSFWTKSVFNNLSEPIKGGYRLFAVDLLGFGKSPKPRESMYTLSDHVEMIEKSVISPNQLNKNSFHLVAHSMGCIVAVALAAKYSKCVKSVTLVAPPCLPSAKDGASTSVVLKALAGKRVWPPLAFGKSIMSWYEHVGRCFCFLVCRNHRTWEAIMKLLSRRRDLSFMMVDLTRHTHHSAWHSMHNVICGGAKFMDEYLQTLNRWRVKVCIIHGDKDVTVPLECSINLKMKFPDIVDLNIIKNADHATVIFGRKKDFAHKLQHIWASSSHI